MLELLLRIKGQNLMIYNKIYQFLTKSLWIILYKYTKFNREKVRIPMPQNTPYSFSIYISTLEFKCKKI